MKILVDVNLSPIWVDWLAEAGFEAIYWGSLGANDTPDGVILQFAREHAYVILTFDLDFGIDLANHHNARPSVVQIRGQFVHVEELRVQVLLALKKATPELEQGALVTISSNRLRIRSLPVS